MKAAMVQGMRRRNPIHVTDFVDAQGLRQVTRAEEQRDLHQSLMDQMDDASDGGYRSSKVATPNVMYDTWLMVE